MLNWQKPSRCDNSGPNCVEVSRDELGNRYVRDSKEPGVILAFNTAEWTAFEESIRDGQKF